MGVNSYLCCHFFNDHGTYFQHSCTNTPQQNGVVERKHRHLLNVGRALRFQANIPLTFWGESIQTACYLINRLPTPLLSRTTPYKLLHHKPPIYSHFRVFGCLCYATNLTPIHKFDVRARRCIFIGYPLGQKGYRVYDLETKKIFTSRDVVFHEHVFPFSNSPPENQTDCPVLPMVFDGHTPSRLIHQQHQLTTTLHQVAIQIQQLVILQKIILHLPQVLPLKQIMRLFYHKMRHLFVALVDP